MYIVQYTYELIVYAIKVYMLLVVKSECIHSAKYTCYSNEVGMYIVQYTYELIVYAIKSIQCYSREVGMCT